MPSLFEVTAGKAIGAVEGKTYTQADSRATDVTVTTLSGVITTDATELAAGDTAEFKVISDKILKEDVVVVSTQSTLAELGTLAWSVNDVSDGFFKVSIKNTHDSTGSTDSIKINYLILKTGVRQ